MGGGEGLGGALDCLWWHPDAPGGGEVGCPPGMIIHCDESESERPVVIETLEAPGHSDNPNHSNSALFSSFCICIVHETTFVLQSVSAIVFVSVSALRLLHSLYHSAITAIIIIFIIIPIIIPQVSQNPHSFAQSGLGHHLKRHG